MSKKDEALKLALDYLLSKQIGAHVIAALREALAEQPYPENFIDALKYDVAKRDFWEGCVPEPDSTCSNALRAQGKAYPRTCKKCGLGPCIELAQQALDKKAENAIELWLDYEPSAGTQVSKVWWNGEKLMAKQVPLGDFYKPAQHRAWFTVDELNAWADKKLKENPQWAEQPAQQEPFGYFKAEPFGWTDCAETDEGAVALYQHPPAQPQQEPDNSDDLTIAYMAGVQRGKDLAQRTWVGLTDEDTAVVLTGDASLGTRLDELTPSWIELVRAVEAKLKEKNT